MNKSFKRNLLIGFGMSLLLLMLSSLASYISIKRLIYGSKWVQHTNFVLNKLENLLAVVQDAESSQRGYLLTGDNRFLEPYRDVDYDYKVVINQLKDSTIDNVRQQDDLNVLDNMIINRLNLLKYNIERKSRGEAISDSVLFQGKDYMDNTIRIVMGMKARETALLKQRTSLLDRFASLTPALVGIACLLAVVVTMVFFSRVLKDYNSRLLLQQELEDKERQITERINIIQDIAEKISSGNYSIRLDDEGKDVLGSLAYSLNKMAESLDHSFKNLSHKEWMQAGIAVLNERIISERNLKELTYTALDFITTYTHSQIGAFYLVKDQQHLLLSASIALNKNKVETLVPFGEGLAGQCALSGKEIVLQNIPDDGFVVDYSAGAIRPVAIIAIPVYHEKKLKGVVELAAIKAYSPATLEFVNACMFSIGMAIHSAHDQEKLKLLIEETLAQSEELQTQHTELENINAEIKSQSEKLQASEEELRVQQEELRQANGELEERSQMLEEKNEMILERNFEIQAKAEQLALSTKYKSEFLANMSHELRTPLNSILLLSRLLSENHSGNLSADEMEYASVIQSSGNGLLMLIDEILDLSKIESGKMELEYREVAIREVANAMLALFAPLAKDKGITFTIDLTADAPERIETDQLRLEQILRNLVSNALKFTAQGSVVIQIWGDATQVNFAVKDTGVGIARNKQESIFEAFKQADGSTRRKYGGTGLGLSISRELAKLLGGKIHLQSEENKGSTFTVTLPLRNTADADLVELSAYAAQDGANAEVTSQMVNESYLASDIPAAVADDRNEIVSGDKVILIIEDDTAFARSLLEFTRKKGYKGVVAVRGDDGVLLAQQYLPLGILLDVQLPVKSGWEVMDALKSNSRTRPIPVHMMSSHEVTKRSLAEGAVDFINKPVAFEKLGEIFTKIEHALSRYPKKVLIVEENDKHAQALANFLQENNITTEVKNSVGEGITALNRSEMDCVILDMGMPGRHSYEALEELKKTPGFENLPIIIFTGKSLSYVEEMKIKQYAETIVIKTAHSYQRILDEISLFLHLVEDDKKSSRSIKYPKPGERSEILKGKTVLIADDDVRNIYSLTKSLESFGIKVLTAINGNEALEKLSEAKKVNLVLMDMMMPEMDGYETTRRIRANPGYKNLPVIAVTAKAMTGDREKCIEAGASDYITKPVDTDQLISLLRVWLYE